MPKSRIEYNFLILLKSGRYEYDFKAVPSNLFGDKQALVGFYKTHTTELRQNDIREVIPLGAASVEEDVEGTHNRVETPNLYCIRFTEEFETYIEAFSTQEAVDRFEEETIAGVEEKSKYIRSQLECIDDVEDLAGFSVEHTPETLIHRLSTPDRSLIMQRLLDVCVSEAKDDVDYHLRTLYRIRFENMFEDSPDEALFQELKDRYEDAWSEMLHAEWRKHTKDNDE